MAESRPTRPLVRLPVGGSGRVGRASDENVEGKLGADHPSTLTSMGNLASTYRHQGRYNAAEELQIQVMENRNEEAWNGPSRHVYLHEQSGMDMERTGSRYRSCRSNEGNVSGFDNRNWGPTISTLYLPQIR